MSKLNKIFLAVIVALLVTAVCEVVFIFVYKPTQTIPTPQISQVSPTPSPNPTNLAISPSFINYISGITAYQNQTVTLEIQISAKIQSIIYNKKNPNVYYSIHLVKNGTNSVHGIAFSQDQVNNIKVFAAYPTKQVPLSLSDLRAGDNISVISDYDASSATHTPDVTILVLK